MLKKLDEMQSARRTRILVAAIIAAFSTICCLTQLLCGDDFLNYYSITDPNARFFESGRYATAYTGTAIICFPVLRFVVYIPILTLYLWMIARFMQFRKKQLSQAWVAITLFCLMPPLMFKTVIMWMGSYSTYVPPTVLIMFYLHLIFQEFYGKPVVSKVWIPACAVIGSASVLYAEHTAIYCCTLAVFVLIWAGFRKNLKIRAYQITYAVGAIIGTVIMFMNPIYQKVSTGSDSATARNIEYNPLDILMKIYIDVVPHFCDEYWIINLVIAFSLAILYFHTDRSAWNKERTRIAKLSLGCVIAFALYFFMNSCFVRLIPISNVRLYAVETAMTFLYLISVVYLGYVLLERDALFRIVTYLFSAILVSAPFCMVHPVTERCFFANFTFWLLIASELFGNATAMLSINGQALIRRTAAIFCAGSICYISYINIINFWANSLSVSYIKEQLAQHQKCVEVIEAPYPDYTFSDIFKYMNWSDNPDVNSKYSYYFMKYYEITDIDPNNLTFVKISLGDYFENDK